MFDNVKWYLIGGIIAVVAFLGAALGYPTYWLFIVNPLMFTYMPLDLFRVWQYHSLYNSHLKDIDNTIALGRIFDNRVYSYCLETVDSEERYFHTVGKYFVENAYLYKQCQRHIEEGRFNEIVKNLIQYDATKPPNLTDEPLMYKNDNLMVNYTASKAYFDSVISPLMYTGTWLYILYVVSIYWYYVGWRY